MLADEQPIAVVRFASLGVGIFGAKLYAFALASTIAGLGGILLAFKDHPEMPRPFLVVDIWQRDGRSPMGVAPVWCSTLAEAHQHWCGRTGDQ